MTPDIEQVRAELVRTMASTIGSMVGAATASATARIAFDAADNILEALNYAALLAAIDELTAERDKVLALHANCTHIPDASMCHVCCEAWPCETVRALTKAVQ